MKIDSKIKRALALGTCACMLFSVSGCGKKGDYVHGKKGYYSQIDNGVSTEVHNQGAYGNCWAHATNDAIRLSYILKNGKDVPITVDEIMEITMGADKTEGLITTNKGQEKNIGGSSYIAAWALSNGCGGYVLTEEKVLSSAAMGQYHGKEYGFLSNRATREQLQELIRSEGALLAIMNIGTGIRKTHGYSTIYDESMAAEKSDIGFPSRYFTHEVVIVGWDDNFPKSYFGEEFGVTPPSENGAWLLKDSGGNNSGDDGYYWVSYESPMVFTDLMQVSDKYKEVVHYETSALGGIRTGEETTVANVFHHKGQLAAVGTYVGITEGNLDPELLWGTPDDTRIRIEIRDANMEKVLATKECEFDFEGYYVIELDTPIEVDDFSVVVTYHAAAPVEVCDVESFEAGEETIGKRQYRTTSEKGESFVLVNGEWMDLSDMENCEALGYDYPLNNCCIKALFS